VVCHPGERRRVGGIGMAAPHRGGRRKDRGPSMAAGGSGRSAMAPGRRARVSPCHTNRETQGRTGGPRP
jgi:hypothetical protein